MGKKKKRKKAKKRKQLLKRIEKTIDKGDGVSYDDLAVVGLGVLVDSAKDKKSKRFWKTHKRGTKAAAMGFPVIDSIFAMEEETDLVEPVISYRHQGGGWYDIEVGGSVVDRVQGETDAAERAGELLEQAAAMDGAIEDGVSHSGGGWYELVVGGVPVERVQGQEAAETAMERIESLNASN